MEQDKIWEYWQNKGLVEGAFPDARPRYMMAQIGPKPQKILNIGVGSGALEKYAQRAGKDVYCLDPSNSAIERVRQELGLEERAQCGYAQNIPFQNDFFDLVVMSEVLEHLNDDVLSNAVVEVERVLRPGGTFWYLPYRENLERKKQCVQPALRFSQYGHVQVSVKSRCLS